MDKKFLKKTKTTNSPNVKLSERELVAVNGGVDETRKKIVNKFKEKCNKWELNKKMSYAVSDHSQLYCCYYCKHRDDDYCNICHCAKTGR